MGSKHLKLALWVCFLLYTWIHSLWNYNHELSTEAVCKHEVSPLDFRCYNDFIRANKVCTEGLLILCRLRLHRNWVFREVNQVKHKLSLHGHFSKFLHVKLIVPSLPSLREPRANFRFEILNTGVVFFSNELWKERFVIGSWTLLVMHNIIISGVVVQKMLERYTRIVTL